MIATLASLLFAQSAQTDPAVLLRRDVAHASSHTYFMSYTMNMDMAGVPGAEALSKKPMTMSVNYREVIKPLGGGKAKVTVTMGTPQVQSQFSEVPLPKPKETTSTMIIDEFNRVTSMKSPALAASPMGSALFGGSTPFGMASFYPTKPVRYGDTWTLGDNSNGKFMGFDGFGQILITYLGTDQVGSTPCYRTQLGMDMNLGAMVGKITALNATASSVAPTGMLSVTGYTLTSQKDGGVVHCYVTGNGNMDMKADGNNVKMKLNFAMEVRRTS